VLVVCDGRDPGREAALAGHGVHLLRAADLPTALAALRGRELRHLFVEGGAGVARSFLGLGLVDRLVIFRGPLVLGAEALPAFGSGDVGEPAGFRLRWSREVGDDVVAVYAPSRSPE
jgi:diaminohydroxyphosphoribosylaminopyrimidine deaminase/5-amino-6-(5-phosphoribosylamino)uracil reductase